MPLAGETTIQVSFNIGKPRSYVCESPKMCGDKQLMSNLVQLLAKLFQDVTKKQINTQF